MLKQILIIGENMRFNIDDNPEKPTTTISSLSPQNTVPSVDTFVTNLNNSVAELQKMKEEMQAKMKAQFDVIVKDFFKIVPKMKAIAWTQYSPYFNDGDECIFSVQEVSVLSFVPEYVSYDYDEEDEDEDYDDEDDNETKDKETKPARIIVSDYNDSNVDLLTAKELEACNAVREFISQNEDLMHDLYGNHVGVIVTENGTEVQDYEHD